MKCRIEVDMNNAAFDEAGPRMELTRVIEDGLIRLQTAGPQTMTLRDYNGNTVGTLIIEEG